jgi:glycosyltransferase involved in cell wall biosynthesis
VSIRVLHIVDSDQRRGAEVFASELTSVLKGQPVDQHVVTLASTTTGGLDFSVQTSALPNGGPVLPLLKIDLRILFGLWRLIRRMNPDIIQGHGGDTLKYAAVATVGHSARLVQRAIGSPPEWVRRGPRRLAYAFILSRSVRIVAVAESVRCDIIDVFRVPAERVVVIPSACGPARIAATAGREAIRARLGIPVDASVIISLGALTWEKDPLSHVEVTASLIRGDSECRHLIVGDGPLRATIEGRIRDLAIESRVMMLGTRDDIGDLLAASDVMLLASRIEGMPAAVIEAGFAGVPVVAFSVAGVGEVILDGVTGFLVPPGDIKGLVSAIKGLLDDRDLRQTMSEAARRWTLGNYDIETVGPKYFELYKDVLHGRVKDPNSRSGE